jgi:hypothetical protein
MDPVHDMMLGSQSNIVGNNGSLRTAAAGDLVIITADDSVQIVRLIERLAICTLWKDAGGPCIWDHNFVYVPLTSVFHKKDVQGQLQTLYNKYGITRNPANFFNSRLHAHELFPIVLDLVESKKVVDRTDKW